MSLTEKKQEFYNAVKHWQKLAEHTHSVGGD